MKNIFDFVEDGVVLDHYPKEWKNTLKGSYILNFRNLAHFKYAMSQLTLKSTSFEKVSYEQCVKDLTESNGLIEQGEYDLIKAKVKENLIARKLISKDIYKGFEYTTEGDTIDVARFAAGNPECCIKPLYKGKVDFYELSVNIAVHCGVSEQQFKDRIARLLATVELLEQNRIYIKLNAVAYGTNITYSDKFDKRDCVFILPVFSHKEKKNITTMSSVINSRLHRKFNFAIMESIYGEKIDGGYGRPTSLPKVVNLNKSLDECQLAEDIIDQFVTKCKKKR